MPTGGRKHRSLINIGLSLISQLITVIVGMLLPRALMINYGSATNGLITSLQQMISYLTLIEGGLLSTVAVSLYKPLADNDINKVDQILFSAKYFYRKTGIVFCIALIIFAAVYPMTIAHTGYSYSQILLMVLLIGMNGATQILIIGKYKALLMAAQLNGVSLAINAISTALYSIILIAGAYINMDVISALSVAISAYIIRAFMYYLAVKIKLPQYNFQTRDQLVSFPQRGDAFTSQILTMISLNGGVMILSFMKAPMEQISVYTTYNLVLSGLYMVMYSIENSVTAALGDLSVSGPIEHVRNSYHYFDSIYHVIWSIVIGCLGSLLIPFIRIYTIGVTDINYILPLEAILFILIGATWMLRNQETLLMTAKGRFKDIRKPMAVEAITVILGGVIFYVIFDMKGLLLAKLASVIYMVTYLMKYTYQKLLEETVRPKLKNIAVSLLEIAIIVLLTYPIQVFFVFDQFLQWLLYAVICGLISIAVALSCAFIFQKELASDIKKKLVKR